MYNILNTVERLYTTKFNCKEAFVTPVNPRLRSNQLSSRMLLFIIKIKHTKPFNILLESTKLCVTLHVTYLPVPGKVHERVIQANYYKIETSQNIIFENFYKLQNVITNKNELSRSQKMHNVKVIWLFINTLSKLIMKLKPILKNV